MVEKNLIMENVEIKFPNFAGLEGKYNPKGKRNFCVMLNPELAERLSEDGWNVRILRPKEEGDPIQHYMQVSVSFGQYASKIVLITSSGKTILNEDMVNILDWAEIEKADLMIRPYNWNLNGKQGVKAYCKSLYVTLHEDELEVKYRNIPDSARTCIAEEDNLPF